MNSQEWFILLNSRFEQLHNPEIETTFVDLVEHLDKNGNLIVNNRLHADAIAAMILCGSIATGEQEIVSKILANCCTEVTGIHLNVIHQITGDYTLGPALIDLVMNELDR